MGKFRKGGKNMTHIKPCILTVDLYNTYRERMPEYVQYDRQIPLEITVMAHGKPADLTGMFARISIGKPDGHHVYHDNVEVAGNIISTTFGDQEFATAGLVNVTIDLLDGDSSKVALIPFMIRVKSAVITDETIKSSNDYQTIMTLIEDVRSLDEMFHVEQDNRAEDFAIQMSQQAEAHNAIIAQLNQAKNAHEVAFQDQMNKHNSEFTDAQTQRTNSFDIQMSEWNNAISEQERQRGTAEAKRANAENARDNKETERKQSELARETAEQQRVDAESDRKRSEATRNQDEAIRKSNESNRKTYENDRQSEEEKRIASEIERVNNESKRTTNELARITAEADRANQESTRMATESKRATAESARVDTESKRATAEKVRVNQEEARRLAEEDRTTRMTIWEAKAEEMAQETQEMVSSAQSFINANESRLLEDNARTDYMGNAHNSIKDVMDANVEFVLDEVNTVHYEGQHITATDTVARQVKHAELKGQTLVNLHKRQLYDLGQSTETSEAGKYANIINETNHTSFDMLDDKTYGWGAFAQGGKLTLDMLKPNTKYLVYFGVAIFPGYITVAFRDGSGRNVISTSVQVHKGTNYAIVTTVNEIIKSQQLVYITIPQQHIGHYEFKDIMIIEYQEGMENWDIPYFEGMKSVTNATVTMTGKNLFNPSVPTPYHMKCGDGITDGSLVGIIPVEPKTTYTLSVDKDTSKGRFIAKMSNRLLTKSDVSSFHQSPVYTYLKNNYANGRAFEYILTSKTSVTFTTLDDCHYLYVNVDSGYSTPATGEVIVFSNMSLEKSATRTSYEPHKSNILSTPQDLELRGIGDVQDTLNLVTGEYTKVIYEYTFTGDEGWKIHGGNTGGYTYFMFSSDRLPIKPNDLTNIPISCDRLPIVTHNDFDSGLKSVGINLSHFFRLNFKDCNSNDGATVEDLKAYLKANPTTVQYLIGKSIKTVDLKGQKVYSYDGTTHYICSSAEGSLVPILSIDVPTNLPALVSRQRNTIQELEKENEVLKEEVLVVDRQRENGDLELLSSDFDIDFRLMEIEFALGVPMIATFKEMRSTARTSYEMAKALILGGKYEHSDMEYKLGRYLERKQITQDQYDELIALMDADELI